MVNSNIKISFVIPCYRSEQTIRAVVEEIRDAVSQRGQFDYEIILVDDFSPDGTYEVIKQLTLEDMQIHGLSFSKNFGQHSALMAGLRKSSGEIVVCLDDDGQTPANEVFRLVDMLDHDTDVVYASYQYSGKQHSIFRNIGSAINNWMLRILLSKPKGLEITSFFAAKRYVINEVCKYVNPFPYAIGLILQTTDSIKNVSVNHRARLAGRSGYTFKKLLHLWLNGFTAFSVRPLRVASALGGMFSLVGFLFAIYLIIRKIVVPTVPMGYSSIMAGLIFIGGMLMLMLGMLGEYVGRIYISINRNPQYVIRRDTDK